MKLSKERLSEWRKINAHKSLSRKPRKKRQLVDWDMNEWEILKWNSEKFFMEI